MDLMKRIERLMEEHDLNRVALANIAGVSPGAVTQWFNGSFTPKTEALSRIADYLGVSVEYLMTGRDAASRVSAVAARMVPVRVFGTVSCGSPDDAVMFDGEAMLYDEIAERHPNCYALRVSGSCMDKVFTSEDYIFVDPDMEPRDGSIAVMLVDGEAECRRVKLGVGSMLLVSESHDPQPDIIIRAGDGQEVSCQGVVFWWQARHEVG